METNYLTQKIEIRTESINPRIFLKIKKLITKYYLDFTSTTEDCLDYRNLHVITLKANFCSLEQMFKFNKKLKKILKN